MAGEMVEVVARVAGVERLDVAVRGLDRAASKMASATAQQVAVGSVKPGGYSVLDDTSPLAFNRRRFKAGVSLAMMGASSAMTLTSAMAGETGGGWRTAIDVVGSGVSGALAGSFFGPVGAAVGGLFGVASGVVQALSDEARSHEEARRAAHELSEQIRMMSVASEIAAREERKRREAVLGTIAYETGVGADVSAQFVKEMAVEFGRTGVSSEDARKMSESLATSLFATLGDYLTPEQMRRIQSRELAAAARMVGPQGLKSGAFADLVVAAQRTGVPLGNLVSMARGAVAEAVEAGASRTAAWRTIAGRMLGAPATNAAMVGLGAYVDTASIYSAGRRSGLSGEELERYAAERANRELRERYGAGASAIMARVTEAVSPEERTRNERLWAQRALDEMTRRNVAQQAEAAEATARAMQRARESAEAIAAEMRRAAELEEAWRQMDWLSGG